MSAMGAERGEERRGEQGRLMEATKAQQKECGNKQSEQKKGSTPGCVRLGRLDRSDLRFQSSKSSANPMYTKA